MVPPNLPKCRLDSWQDCLGCDYHICIFLTKSVNCFGVMQDIHDKLVSSCTCLVFPMLLSTICLWFWWDRTRWGTHYLPNILLHLFSTLVKISPWFSDDLARKNSNNYFHTYFLIFFMASLKPSNKKLNWICNSNTCVFFIYLEYDWQCVLP
jgi:hypothetical protein